MNAPTGGGSDGQSREETAETLVAEATETVEEGPTSLAAKPELEDINDIQAEEVKEEKTEGATASYMSWYGRKIIRTKRWEESQEQARGQRGRNWALTTINDGL